MLDRHGRSTVTTQDEAGGSADEVQAECLLPIPLGHAFLGEVAFAHEGDSYRAALFFSAEEDETSSVVAFLVCRFILDEDPEGLTKAGDLYGLVPVPEELTSACYDAVQATLYSISPSMVVLNPHAPVIGEA
jgi:hypothetical protein